MTVPDNKSIGSTFAVDSGKWYVEFYADSSSFVSAGIVGDSQAFGANLNGSSVAYMYSYVGTVYKQGTGDTTPTSFTSGDVIGFYVDLDNNKLYIYKNGAGITTSEGTHSVGSLGISITNRNYYFGTTSNGNNAQVIFNFGQDSTFAGAKPMGAFTDDSELGTFQYQPPAGFKSLCSANLPIPTIIDGSEHFNTVLWTGNGTSSGRSITGVGFQPDFVWGKPRSLSYTHSLSDVVRGANKRLSSNATSAEDTNFTYGYTSSFDADGFTTSSGSSSNENWNTTGATFVAWNWKAGGAAVSNTDGSITSQVSANVDAGFSVITWTGTGANGTIGHSLNSAPEMMIVKDRDNAYNWYVYHNSTGSNLRFEGLNTASAAATVTDANQFVPTNSVIAISSFASQNTSGADMLCYAFHSVEGFSKVGSYTGNGTNQFIHTGFRPAFVLAKAISAADNWRMYDSARLGYNPNNSVLYPNLSNAEDSPTNHIDLLSNGFRWMSDNNNANGHTFIYLAFAEHPFKYANAR